MSQNGLVVTTGAEAIRAAEQGLFRSDKITEYPYEWEQAPPGSKHIFAFGAVEVPDQGATVEIVSYQIKNNWRAVLRYLMVEYTGGNYNPGDFTWTLGVNLVLGSSIAQGVSVKDYVNVPFNMGSRVGGPWPICSGQLSEFKSRDILSIQAANVNLSAGTPNFIAACLIGYEWPSA